MFRHKECVYSKSSWNFPPIRSGTLGCWMHSSRRHFEVEKMLLLSNLHWYSLTFGYKYTSKNKRGPPQVNCHSSKADLREHGRCLYNAYTRAPSVWGWEARSYFQDSMRGRPSSPVFTLGEARLLVHNHLQILNLPMQSRLSIYS